MIMLSIVISMAIGGAIVYLFKDAITKDEAKVVAYFRASAAKVKAAHTNDVVNKIIS